MDIISILIYYRVTLQDRFDHRNVWNKHFGLIIVNLNDASILFESTVEGPKQDRILRHIRVFALTANIPKGELKANKFRAYAANLLYMAGKLDTPPSMLKKEIADVLDNPSLDHEQLLMRKPYTLDCQVAAFIRDNFVYNYTTTRITSDKEAIAIEKAICIDRSCWGRALLNPKPPKKPAKPKNSRRVREIAHKTEIYTRTHLDDAYALENTIRDRGASGNY